MFLRIKFFFFNWHEKYLMKYIIYYTLRNNGMNKRKWYNKVKSATQSMPISPSSSIYSYEQY